MSQDYQVLEKEGKIALYGVKVQNGFNPKRKGKVYENQTNPDRKTFTTGIFISPTQKQVIDTYIYDKVSLTAEGNYLFKCVSTFKDMPVYDSQGHLITEPIDFAYIADVIIKIESFTAKDGKNVTFTKCLCIICVKILENEPIAFKSSDDPETFEDIMKGFTRPAPAPISSGLQTNEMRSQNAANVVPNTASDDDLPF